MIKKISGLFLTGIRQFLKIGIPLILIGITGIVINNYDPAALNSITTAIRNHSTSYLFLRWLVLIFFILCWPMVITKIGQQRKATPEQILHWRNENWRMAIWLILIEVVVCENLIGKSIHLLGAN